MVTCKFLFGFVAMKEIWKPVPGYPHIYASNLGRIGRKDYKISYSANKRQRAYTRTVKGGIVPTWPHSVTGRPYVTVCQKNKGVNQLVCLAFKGLPPKGKPEACHIDGNFYNNEELNLYWGSHADNMADMIRHGTSPLGERNGQAKVSLKEAQRIFDRRISGEKGVVLAREFGISSQTVCDILKGRIWPCIKRSI